MEEKLKKMNVKAKTIQNAIIVLSEIENIININTEDIYSTNYGTIIVNFNIKDYSIEIEIGNSELGYFIEKDNKDIVLRQNKMDLSLLKILINDLKSIMN